MHSDPKLKSLSKKFFSTLTFQDISECIIPQWKKNKLREDLKKTKKELDDADRAMKAGRMQRVCVITLEPFLK